jgi:uncharacterized protein (TIGR02246 family)
MTDEQFEVRLAKLEARVQELEDERRIRDLLARYGYNADSGAKRAEQYLSIFTDDGALDITGARWEGKKALREFVDEAVGPTHFDGTGMHLTGSNVVSHISGDEAVVDSYHAVLHADHFGFRVIHAASNEWTLTKVGGQWLIKERRSRRLGTSEFSTNIAATRD